MTQIRQLIEGKIWMVTDCKKSHLLLELIREIKITREYWLTLMGCQRLGSWKLPRSGEGMKQWVPGGWDHCHSVHLWLSGWLTFAERVPLHSHLCVCLHRLPSMDSGTCCGCSGNSRCDPTRLVLLGIPYLFVLWNLILPCEESQAPT